MSDRDPHVTLSGTYCGPVDVPLIALTREQLLDARRWHIEWVDYTRTDRADGWAPQDTPSVMLAIIAAAVNAQLPEGVRWDTTTSVLLGTGAGQVGDEQLVDIFDKAEDLAIDLYPHVKTILTDAIDALRGGAFDKVPVPDRDDEERGQVADGTPPF